MNWQDFCSAVALMLVFEGISPFIMPARMRKLAEILLSTDDRTIRMIGLVSMGAGLCLLYLVRS